MKALSFLILSFSLVFCGCEKEYCVDFTDTTGEKYCEKCFRKQEQLDSFTEKYAPLGSNFETACDD